MSKRLITCKHCGTHLATDNRRNPYYLNWDWQAIKHRNGVCTDYFFSVGDGTGICLGCLRLHYGVCEECRRVATDSFKVQEFVVEGTKRQLCDNCKGYYYKECPHCGNAVHRNHMVKVGTEKWCPACVEAEHLIKCDRCHRYVHEHDTEEYFSPNEKNTRICHECLGLHPDWYTTCAKCGCYVPTGQHYSSYYDTRVRVGSDGKHYCPHCYCTVKARIVRGYHGYEDIRDKDDPKKKLKTFRTDEFNFNRLERLSMGVELEIDGGGVDETKALAISSALGHPLDDFEHNLYCSRDGSLCNGLEFVTQPMPLKRLLGYYNWRAGFSKAVSLGYRSHDANTCGLHVHIDRKYFSDARLNPQDSLVILFLNNMEWLRPFSRRRNFSYCHFYDVNCPIKRSISLPLQSYALRKFDGKDLSKAEKLRSQWEFKHGLPRNLITSVSLDTMIEVQAIESWWTSHGNALNFAGKNTIELRFFRGTLALETFVAALQLVEMMSFPMKHFTAAQLALVNLRWFINFATIRGYAEFLKYTNKIMRRWFEYQTNARDSFLR